jgi:hypothetical protein
VSIVLKFRFTYWLASAKPATKVVVNRTKWSSFMLGASKELEYRGGSHAGKDVCGNY